MGATSVPAMKTDLFAEVFEQHYRDIYGLAARRVRDKRDLLSTASIAFLSHVAAAGPLTLRELAQHLNRAQSTTSEIVDQLTAKGLLQRDRDPQDSRRTLIWLSAEGRARLAEELSVLAIPKISEAAATMDEAERNQLLTLMDKLVTTLKTGRKAR